MTQKKKIRKILLGRKLNAGTDIKMAEILLLNLSGLCPALTLTMPQDIQYNNTV